MKSLAYPIRTYADEHVCIQQTTDGTRSINKRNSEVLSSNTVEPQQQLAFSQTHQLLAPNFTRGATQWAASNFSPQNCVCKTHIKHHQYKGNDSHRDRTKKEAALKRKVLETPQKQIIKYNSGLKKLLTSLLFIVLIMDIPGIDTSKLSKMACDYYKYQENCYTQLNETAASSHSDALYCPGEFDGFICWPHGSPNSTVSASCPDYLDWGNVSRLGYRFCQTNGEWFSEFDPYHEVYIPFRHIAECDVENMTSVRPTDEAQNKLLAAFRVVYTCGYVLSLLCLFVALLILTFFKKLHCTRNYIHMNLMISFILRYSITIVKDVVLDLHYSVNDHVMDSGISDLRQYCENYSGGWILTRCRLAVTFMHYTIIANYFWLLVEGVYLQMLLVFVMLEHKFFAFFMLFGWGGPWCFVLLWIYLRIKEEDTGCWDVNLNLKIWWVIRCPTIISIVVNFIIFVNIIRLIVSKLRANNMTRTDYKFRLAKSTLALIPLLGIHYIIFLVITDELEGTKSKVALNLKLCVEMFFTSIQGTLVAVFYCFLNEEVRTEMKKWWHDRSWKKGLPRGHNNRKNSMYNSNGSGAATSATYISRHSAVENDIQMQDLRLNNNKKHRPSQDLESAAEMRYKSNGYDLEKPSTSTDGNCAQEEAVKLLALKPELESEQTMV